MRLRHVGLASVFALAASGAIAQNLVGNGGFASSLDAWDSFSESGTVAWSALDAGGSASSGSALATSTSASTASLITLLTQCVPVSAGTEYAISGDARFTDGEATTGSASVNVYWNSGPVCQAYMAGDGVSIEKSAPGTWLHNSATIVAPAGSTSALVFVGVNKTEAGGVLSAYVDNVAFGPASAPAESLIGYIPVAGSAAGGSGSFFKTSVQLVNPGFGPISGHFVFHPAGTPASPGDPTLGFALAPGQYFAWDDVVAAMGRSGLGSIDVYGAGGDAPVILVRIFDDAGSAGTKGFTESLVPVSGVSGAPGVSVTGVLLCPADVARFRYNIGLRTVGDPVHVTVAVLDSAGATLHTADHDYPANYFVQTSVADFLGGFAIGNSQSLRITFSGGGLILYGATVDNTTNDPSAQFMPYLFAIA